jgi:hypothetical protein
VNDTALYLLVAVVGVAGALFCGWQAGRQIRAARDDDYRTRNDRAAAQRITRFEERPEPPAPGLDDDLLADCNAIYTATDTRRENP